MTTLNRVTHEAFLLRVIIVLASAAHILLRVIITPPMGRGLALYNLGHYYCHPGISLHHHSGDFLPSSLVSNLLCHVSISCLLIYVLLLVEDNFP